MNSVLTFLIAFENSFAARTEEAASLTFTLLISYPNLTLLDAEHGRSGPEILEGTEISSLCETFSHPDI